MDSIYTIYEFTPPSTYTAAGESFTDPVVAEAFVADLALRYPQRRFMLRHDEAPARVPVLAKLDPNTAALGDPSFTLRALGSDFTADSVILWNGAPEPTRFVSPTEVTTSVNMATAEVAMTLPVAVQTAPGQTSNELPFTFTESGSGVARSTASNRRS